MDKGWMKHINYGWNAEAIRERLTSIEGIEPQDPADQNPFKVSYFLHDKELAVERVTERLGKMARNASVVITQSAYLDILPKRASKGRAVRYIGNKWSIPITEAMVCGDAGNDVDMFTGASCGVVVGNHAPEMEQLRGLRRVYFAQAHSAAGILEGLRHFRFLD